MMNALAHKYLPMEFQMSDFQCPNASKPKAFNIEAIDSNLMKETPNNLNTDMSMTSYRYMEKYGLL